MVELLEQLVFWHWWILAIVLVVLEMLAPGVIFLWIGLGAAATGFIALAQPDLDWQLQLVTFSVLSVISGVAGRIWVAKRPIETDLPALNQRGQQYVGRSFTLKEPIVDGFGKVIFDDSTWKVSGEDMDAGTHVTVSYTHLTLPTNREV